MEADHRVGHGQPPEDLQIVVCGAGPADVTQLIHTAQERSWTAAVAATARRTLPAVDALVVAPATYHSINKIALGLAGGSRLPCTG